MKTAAKEKQAKYTIEVTCHDEQIGNDELKDGKYRVETDGFLLVGEPFESKQHTSLMGSVSTLNMADGIYKIDEGGRFTTLLATTLLELGNANRGMLKYERDEKGNLTAELDLM